MLLRYNLETVGTMKLHSFKHATSGRVLGVTQLQTFSSVSKFSQISDAIEYIYQFTYSSGISRMSSRGYMVFESIPFGICYFALRYGEPGSEMYPGIEFYTSNYTMKQIPKVDNMINKFTYATIRLSSVYVTWKIKLVINDHLRGANGFSCSIQNLPWISITKPTLVTLSLTSNTIGEYYRQYFNAIPGYFIRVRIIQLMKMPCHTNGVLRGGQGGLGPPPPPP